MYSLLQKKTFSCRLDRSDYTHPLKTSHFENPLSIFDKITYGKGGYLVKGLLAAMGEQNFWKAVGKYLQLYSWKSTNINQFF
jgi:aminopeptidase N